DEAAATYAPRLTKEEGLIEWSRPAESIHNLIRGLHPWPLAFSFINGRRVILRRSSLVIQDDRTRWTEFGGQPGTVIQAAGDRLVVATGSGPIHLLEIQPEGKRPMTAREFLAGHSIAPGTRFSPHP